MQQRRMLPNYYRRGSFNRGDSDAKISTLGSWYPKNLVCNNIYYFDLRSVFKVMHDTTYKQIDTLRNREEDSMAPETN